MKLCKRCAKEIDDEAMYCPDCGKKQTAEAAAPKPKNKKQANGEGGIRQLPSGKYQARAVKHGKRVALGSFDTKKEAEKCLVDYKSRELETASDYNCTLEQAYESYKKSMRYQKLSEKGKEGIQSAWGHLEALGNYPLRELSTGHYEELINNTTKKQRVKTRTPAEIQKMKPSLKKKYEEAINRPPEALKYESRKKIKDLVKLICEHAISRNIITVNYGEFIVVIGELPDAHGVFSEDMRQALFAHDDDERVKLLLIYIYMGWRPSELLLVQKENVHFTADDEHNSYSNGYIIGGIKTDAGKNREVPIHSKVLSYIKYFYNKDGAKPGDALIQINGKHISYDYYLKYIFPDAMKIANLPEVDEFGDVLSPHSTRNTFALMLYECKTANEVIARLMGHTSFSTSNKHYIRNRQNREFVDGEFSKLLS